MKSNSNDDKSEFQNSTNEFGESSEDTSGFFESSSTLNNETSYKSSTPEQFAANGRLRSRKMQQQEVSLEFIVIHINTFMFEHFSSLHSFLNKFTFVPCAVLRN